MSDQGLDHPDYNDVWSVLRHFERAFPRKWDVFTSDTALPALLGVGMDFTNSCGIEISNTSEIRSEHLPSVVLAALLFLSRQRIEPSRRSVVSIMVESFYIRTVCDLELMGTILGVMTDEWATVLEEHLKECATQGLRWTNPSGELKELERYEYFLRRVGRMLSFDVPLLVANILQAVYWENFDHERSLHLPNTRLLRTSSEIMKVADRLNGEGHSVTTEEGAAWPLWYQAAEYVLGRRSDPPSRS